MTGRIDAHFVAAGRFHDIDFARLEVLKLLGEHLNIRTTVAMDFSNVERIAACTFLITYTCDMLPTVEETKAIKAFLEGGGRWLALHGTNSILRFVEGGVDSPEERDDLMEILGTQFKAHPPIGPFRVEITERDHALTKGLEDFDIIDELYITKTKAPIKVLMQTRFDGEATGFVEAGFKIALVYRYFFTEFGNRPNIMGASSYKISSIHHPLERVKPPHHRGLGNHGCKRHLGGIGVATQQQRLDQFKPGGFVGRVVGHVGF